MEKIESVPEPEIDRASTISRTILDFRNTPIQGIEVLGRYNYKEPHPCLPPERFKNHIEIYFMDRGAQVLYVNQKEHILKGNEVLIIKPNEIHSTGEHPEDRGRLYWLFIDLRSLLFDFPEQQSDIIKQQLLNITNPHFTMPNNTRVFLEKIFSLYKSDEPLKFISIRNLMLSYILSIIENSSRNSERFYNFAVEDTIQFINNNIFKRLTITDLAYEAGLSESYFKASFKKETGIPPIDYVNKLKIEKACELMKETSLSATAAAYELEFSSSQYFTSVFKKYKGLTPGQWLRLNR
jgi:AraC-like DNA-binding protein